LQLSFDALLMVLEFAFEMHAQFVMFSFKFVTSGTLNFKSFCRLFELPLVFFCHPFLSNKCVEELGVLFPKVVFCLLLDELSRLAKMLLGKLELLNNCEEFFLLTLPILFCSNLVTLKPQELVSHAVELALAEL